MSSDREKKILKLYAYLKDENKTKEIGSKILKAMITDILRSHSGHTIERRRPPIWGRVWVDETWLDIGATSLTDGAQNELSKTLAEISGETELTEEELRIAKELGILKNNED